jgi:hypothetical protein
MKEKTKKVAVEGFRLLLAAGAITWLICLLYIVVVLLMGWYVSGSVVAAIVPARKPELLKAPEVELDDPEPPNSPNVWVGDFYLDWGGTDYKMVLGRDGSYKATASWATWEGSWQLQEAKGPDGKVLKSHVTFWVSESCNPSAPDSWLHWGVVLPKRFPRKAPISEGDCKGTVVGVRQRR